MTINDWYEYRFKSEEIERIKTLNSKKQQEIDYNNMPDDYKNRWIGACGEITCSKYLKGKNISYISKSNLHNSFIDNEDFIIKDNRYDLKTVGTNYYPKLDYSCHVNKKQLNKRRPVKGYIFSRFIFNINLCVLLGGIDYKDFIKKSRLLKEGELMDNGYIVKAKMYEMPINLLIPLDDYLT